MPDPAAAAALLAPILHEDPARLQTLLTPRSARVHYVALKRHFAVPGTTALPVQALTAAIKKTGLAGIYAVGDTSRSYPDGPLAAQVLGFTNRDGVGIAGLEHSQEALLRGHDGKIVAEIDKDGRFLPGTTRHRVEAENGADIVTTLDYAPARGGRRRAGQSRRRPPRRPRRRRRPGPADRRDPRALPGARLQPEPAAPGRRGCPKPPR